MPNKMEVHGSQYVEAHVDVAVEVGSHEICEFIEVRADKEDINRIEQALADRTGSDTINTLEQEYKMEIAKKISQSMTLPQLWELEEQLENGELI